MSLPGLQPAPGGPLPGGYRGNLKHQKMRAYSHIPVLLSATALLTALSSCSKVETTERRDASITFRSSVVTKAPVDTDAQIDRFAVWAYRSDDAATLPEVEMNGIEVYRNGTGWAYDNVRMWTDGFWYFEALYPCPRTLGQGIGVDLHIPKTDAQTEMDGVYISYFDGTEADTDLMLAKADRSYDSSAPDVSPVALDFNHLLSRVSICAEAGDDNVTVSSLTFGGMYVYGSYNDALEDAWQPITKTTEDGVVQEIDQPYGDFDADLSGITFPLPSQEQVTLLPDLLLIPQIPAASGSGLNEMKVTVTYTVGTQPEETKTISLPQDPVWQPGRHYRYTIKFAMADVTLSVEMVQWDERDYTVIF